MLADYTVSSSNCGTGQKFCANANHGGVENISAGAFWGLANLLNTKYNQEWVTNIVDRLLPREGQEQTSWGKHFHEVSSYYEKCILWLCIFKNPLFPE